MNRSILWSLAILLVIPSPSMAATTAQKCEAAKEIAAGVYSKCRLKAESQFTKTGDATRLSIALTKCSQKLSKNFDKADDRYGLDCPTLGDTATVEGFLGATSDQLVTYLANGAPEPGAGFCDEADTILDPSTGKCVSAIECGSGTRFDPVALECTAACGDGLVDPGEDCDSEPAGLNGATCSSLGLVDGVLTCAPGCAFDTSACLRCGNGVVDDPPEECDGGDLGGETCASLGLGEGTLDCTSSCVFDTSLCFSCSISGTEWVEHGDGTVTDCSTGLMWEMKTGTVDSAVLCTVNAPCPDPHDVNNRYSWSLGASSSEFDGTAKTQFLDLLNDVAGGGADCFAGHCDWRLPTTAGISTSPTGEPPELESLLIAPFPCGTRPCTIIPGVTFAEWYWTSSTTAHSTLARIVSFYDGAIGNAFKNNGLWVRAVRKP